jgi:hypothetical protein
MGGRIQRWTEGKHHRHDRKQRPCYRPS